MERYSSSVRPSTAHAAPSVPEIDGSQYTFVGEVYPWSCLITPGRDHAPTTICDGYGSDDGSTPAAASSGASTSTIAACAFSRRACSYGGCACAMPSGSAGAPEVP